MNILSKSSKGKPRQVYLCSTIHTQGNSCALQSHYREIWYKWKGAISSPAWSHSLLLQVYTSMWQERCWVAMPSRYLAGERRTGHPIGWLQTPGTVTGETKVPHNLPAHVFLLTHMTQSDKFCHQIIFRAFFFQVSSRLSVEPMSVVLSRRWLQESLSTRQNESWLQTIVKLCQAYLLRDSKAQHW